MAGRARMKVRESAPDQVPAGAPPRTEVRPRGQKSRGGVPEGDAPRLKGRAPPKPQGGGGGISGGAFRRSTPSHFVRGSTPPGPLRLGEHVWEPGAIRAPGRSNPSGENPNDRTDGQTISPQDCKSCRCRARPAARHRSDARLAAGCAHPHRGQHAAMLAQLRTPHLPAPPRLLRAGERVSRPAALATEDARGGDAGGSLNVGAQARAAPAHRGAPRGADGRSYSTGAAGCRSPWRRKCSSGLMPASRASACSCR
jgi:hypothetical protein